MALVVQKYGGSSVADAESIKRVANRIVDTQRAGNQVTVVVSAMGDSTDELMDLAQQVSPSPPGRELDMLLTAGERRYVRIYAWRLRRRYPRWLGRLRIPGPKPKRRHPVGA